MFLGDIFSSQKLDAEKPIACGLYRLEKGDPLVYTYTYHEMKIIIEGEFQITDETGKSVTARPGDIFYFGKGCQCGLLIPCYYLIWDERSANYCW